MRKVLRYGAVEAAVLLGLAVGQAIAAGKPDFGSNVLIFDPSMKPETIQEQMNKIWDAQGDSEFGSGRYALLFPPGTYAVDVPVGFYTQVMGLGPLPDAVNITGNLHANPAHGTMALVTFWRSAENLAVTPSNGTVRWAVSQAAPIRRLHIRGDLALHMSGFASGGWLSDSLIEGKVDSGPQQQWISRNAEWRSWSGGFLNMFFLGVVNPPEGEWPKPPYTKIATTPGIREKPYLEVNAVGEYGVRVPPLRRDSMGVSWHDAANPGKLIPISKFYIAHADTDTAATINAQLSKGKHLLFTPGIYKLDDTIRVTKADTVVLGLGFATLQANKGAAILSTADADGITVSGILFDAGPTKSPVLLQVGPAGSRARHTANPIVLHDVFFRVGGVGESHTVGNLEINSNDTIVDHTWIWRADHGVERGKSTGWTINTSANGLVVNGNDVTVYGLFVEHHQEYQTVWNGNGGRMYFYQCEIPYDPPDQPGYTSGPGTNGWAAYKVADSVTSHEAWGMGVYSVFWNKGVILTRAIETPKNPNVEFHNMITLSINQNGEISNVINDAGGKTVAGLRVMPRLTSYP